MDSDLIDLKPYFYEKNNSLPDETDVELCEGLALRILTGMKVSEDQLRYIPEEFVESYYDYKYTICNSAIMKRVFSKYPFIKKELNWDWGSKGIGKELLKSVLYKNLDKRFKLDVLCNNEAAISLYKDLGFQIDGKSYKGYAFRSSEQPDCFCMVLNPFICRANRERQQNNPTTELG